jgi:pyridoxal phosphate enzyme (YggS family)
MSVTANLRAVRAAIALACSRSGRDPSDVTLIAVSKGRSNEQIREALDAGQRAFGENRVQELARKARDAALDGAEWHMIGSVQTNKVRDLVRTQGLTMVQSLDRERLADALQEQLAPAGRTLAVLLQVDATDDPGKHGASPAEALPLLRHVVTRCPNLDVQGIMAMGPIRGDAAPVFIAVAALTARLRDASGRPLPVLSMGMTADLDAAIAAGSTMVRVGTGVFGDR